MDDRLTSGPPGIGSTKYLFMEQCRLLKTGWKWVVAFLIGTTIPYVYLDVYAYDQGGLYAVFGFVGWAMGYLLLVGLMQNGGYLDHGKRSGVGTFFVLGIAISIPVGLAAIVFILPGLYLLMRWLPAYCRALLTGEWIGNCMRWSWGETQPFQKPLAIGIVPACLGYVLSIFSLYLYDAYYDYFNWSSYVALTVFANLSMSIGIAWLTIFGIASYGLILAGHSQNDRPSG